MRRLTILVLCTAAAITTPAYAQPMGAQPPSSEMESSDAQTRFAAPNVTVIDINALPTAIQSQVNAMIAQASKDDARALRGSIEATPEASAALKARGLGSDEVVAALVDGEGGLTLITNQGI